MEIKDFIKNFAEQFDDIAIESIHVDTKFRELEEWSSLVALSVIAMVDEIYGVTINGEDMRNAQTVGDLFESVQNKVGQRL